MPCPVNLRQKITTGSKATRGLNAIKRHEAEETKAFNLFHNEELLLCMKLILLAIETYWIGF